MARLRVGALSQRVVVQRRSATLDSYGQPINSWSNLYTMWADVRPFTSREKVQGGAMASSIDYTVTVHYRDDLDTSVVAGAWRLLWRGRYLNIHSAKDLDSSRTLILFECTEGSADGQ